MNEFETLRQVSEHAEPETSLLDPRSQEPTAARQWITTRQVQAWRPPTDVFELNGHLVVVVEIGGMRDGEFNIALQDRRLLISGTRTRSLPERLHYHQMEIRYDNFRTEVNLPFPVERTAVSASYQEGFLRVELPPARNQQIAIVDIGDIGDSSDIDIEPDVLDSNPKG